MCWWDVKPYSVNQSVKSAYVMTQVGALSTPTSGEVNPHDGDLTFLGRVLSSLPVDIRLGKLMLLGHVFGVLEETTIISEYSSPTQ